LLPLVDFISIGSNDMTQFLFAVDRGNPRIADRYDALSPGMLTFIRYVAHKCEAAGVPLSVCGEMAGKPLEAMALLACGVRILSVASPSIGPVKTMIRTLSVAPVKSYLDGLLSLPDRSLRDKLKHFAIDHGVAL
jgi:phosphotransferase system, enzyme I, PtsP